MSDRDRKIEDLAEAVQAFCRALDPPEEALVHLEETPRKVAELWMDHFMEGYSTTPARVLEKTSPGPDGSMVIMRDLDFYSICPHHFLPSHGRAHLAYESTGTLAGFGTMAKLVNACSHRLMLQEEVTQFIADSLFNELGARRAACCIEAVQLCLLVKRKNMAGKVVTMAFAGDFTDQERLEISSLIKPDKTDGNCEVNFSCSGF